MDCNRCWSAVVVIASAFKVLLVPSYHSTDFEVHRNWLAITHSLPISKWYFEDTSEWTLDYPPLFAWFEWLLSHIAAVMDPKIVQLSNLYYNSWCCIVFQRLSVVVSDLVLAYAIKEYFSSVWKSDKWSSSWQTVVSLSVLLMFNTGLLIVDHIHFQYNGMLFGFLLLSIAKLKQGSVLSGAFWFAVLLNLKHIYLYVAPAYIVYLFRKYCFKSGVTGWVPPISSFLPVNLMKLGIIVTAVFGVSFGPFIALGQLDQVLSRLFPFKRGLTHAYWAPNFWALYNFADKIAIKIGSYFGLSMSSVAREAALTAGIVGDDEHSMLPSITPLLTIMLTVLSMLPALIKVWCHPNDFDGFVRSVVLCAFSSFLFGWHVHEKAIILILVPLSLLAVSHSSDASVYFILSTTGHVSLFPLLFLPAENLLRVVPTLLYMIFTYYALIRAICPRREEDARAQLFCNHPLPVLYLLGLLLTQSYCIGVHQFTAFGKRLPFLPLMLTSVYCAVGVVVAWFSCYATMLRLPESEKED